MLGRYHILLRVLTNRALPKTARHMPGPSPPAPDAAITAGVND
ncbi:hypothetical protein I546_6917 [Mycobacterium kansasii 732]|nr:hypothetical protein I546_6917 [Mycobacterium kansasii 732]